MKGKRFSIIKKRCSFFVATTMILSCIGSVSFANTDVQMSESVNLNAVKSWDWGHYPEHDTARKTLTSSGMTYALPAHAESPAENLFTIGGRRFIMLDRNDNGDYFVMADEEYGQAQPIQTNLTSKDVDALNSLMAYEWGFNPETPNSVGAILNSSNGILSGDTQNALGWKNGTYTGSTEPRVIPKEMSDDILEYDWPIEPFFTYLAQAPGSLCYDEFKEWEERQFSEPKNGYTTVKAKLSLLSFTELMAYKEKIGFNDYIKTHVYAGTMLRTPSAQTSIRNDRLCVYGGLLSVRLDDNVNNKITLFQIANFVEPPLYVVRPVMWLKAGFFANNKIDLDSAGSTVLTEMKTAYNPSDYAEKYTIDEIRQIYGSATDGPSVSNVHIEGAPTVGAVLNAGYDYSSLSGKNEGHSDVYWLAADKSDGTYTYTGINSEYFNITDEYKGKYLKYIIVPKDNSDASGEVCMSEPTSAAVADKSTGVYVSDISKDAVTGISISLKNSSTESKQASAVNVKYNTDGSINGEPDVQTISLAADETQVYTRKVDENSSLIILNENERPIFVQNGFKSDTSGIAYLPYRTEVNLKNGEVILTGKSDDAMNNRIIMIVVSKKDESGDKIYYSGASAVNLNGEYIFRFNMPANSSAGDYAVRKITLNSVDNDSVFWINPDDAAKLLSDINSAESVEATLEIIDSNIFALLGSDVWWKVLDSKSKNAIADEVYKNKPYSDLNVIKSIIYEQTALRAFDCCTTGEQIKSLLDAFSDVYEVAETDLVCGKIYKEFSDADKDFAYSAMAAGEAEPTKTGITNAFDRGVLFSAISRAKDPNTILGYLNNDSYRALINGFDNYSDYDPSVLAHYLYSYGDIKNVNEFKTAVAGCKKKSDNTTPSSGGSSSNGSGKGSSAYSEGVKQPVLEPVGNETVTYFDDLGGFEWAKTAIEYLAEKKIVNGVADKAFEPNANVTREQFAKMLTEALGFKAEKNDISFSDVDENSWAYPFVCAAYENGIINGIDENSFGTGMNISREDMAVMAYRAMIKSGYEFAEDSELKFVDSNNIKDYAKDGVAAMSDAKIINGYTDGSFLPDNIATRAEAAQIIYNIITALK